jgi:hypothetical protein
MSRRTRQVRHPIRIAKPALRRFNPRAG